MGQCIVKQPNGLFAIWDAGGDDFIFLDGSEEEISDYLLGQMAVHVMREIRDSLARAKTLGTSSHYGDNWESCLKSVEIQHGAEVAERRKKYEFESAKATETSTG